MYPSVCVGVCVYPSKQDEALCESRSAFPRIVKHLRNTSLRSSLFCCYILLYTSLKLDNRMCMCCYVYSLVIM